MIKIITGRFEETLKGITRTFQWINHRGYIEIPKESK